MSITDQLNQFNRDLQSGFAQLATAMKQRVDSQASGTADEPSGVIGSQPNPPDDGQPSDHYSLLSTEQKAALQRYNDLHAKSPEAAGRFYRDNRALLRSCF